MAQAEENKLPMIFQHVVTRLHDNIVVIGGMLRTDYRPQFKYIWTYNLHTNLWSKYVMREGDKTPPIAYGTFGSIGVTIKNNIYMFATPNLENLGMVWQLNRDREGCFSWHEIPVMKAPSYRRHMAGWEYAEKLWTFGGIGPSPVNVGHLNDFVEVDIIDSDDEEGTNNQLLCFDPSCSEWANLKSSGAVPSPRCVRASTLIGDEVWVYGGSKKEQMRELYNLNINHLSWTKIQCKPTLPELFHPTLICGFTGTHSKLVLHGCQDSYTNKAKNITCVLDISSLSWSEYKTVSKIKCQKGIAGLNSCMLIGGYVGEGQDYKSTVLIRLEPKTLPAVSLEYYKRT